MIDVSDKRKCCGCTACANVCPKKAITLEYDNEGFLYPHVDKEKCINCNICSDICPVINKIQIKNTSNFPIVYACYNKNNYIRLKSSSGGIFYVLACEILKDNGIVIGAAYDEHFGVKHILVNRVNDLYKLMGSKYAQSRLENIYVIVKEQLLCGKKVLFSGTSCQIAGLKKYLRKDFDNLFCVDLICMGIPSAKIWVDYVNTFYNYDSIKDINFKDKTYGWNCFSVKVTYDNCTKIQVGKLNSYMQLFFKGINVRPVCFKCPFKGKHRYSDFTLSDCWGIKKIAPELNDNLGTSTVMIHSLKGKKLFNNLKDKLVYKKITFEQATENNKYAIYSVKENKNRSKFFYDYSNKSKKFDKVVKKYSKIPSYYKFRIRLIQFMNKNFRRFK